MQSPLERAIREHVADYLAGASSLEELKDWLGGATWDVEASGDRVAKGLSYEVKLALADVSSGLATEAEAAEDLRAIISDASAAASPPSTAQPITA